MTVKKLMMAMVAGLIVCGNVFGAALTADKQVARISGEYAVLNVASGTVIYAGSLVAVDTNGYAVPASDTASLKVIGVAAEQVDQRAGVYERGKTLTVRRGVFSFKNGGSLTDANIGDWAFVEDDQTVSTAAEMSNDILAGVIIDVDSAGVWVDVGAVNRAGALAGDSLSVSGAAAISGAVTGSSTVSASGFKIGAVSGYSGAVTNISTLSTNIMKYAGGVLTNSVNVP